MLKNISLCVMGTDQDSGQTLFLTVDDPTAMEAALRAITADPPLRGTYLTGGRSSCALSAAEVAGLVPQLGPLPPAPPPPSPLKQLGDDIAGIAKGDLLKLEQDASLCHQLCGVLQEFAHDGGALDTVKAMALQLRQYQAAEVKQPKVAAVAQPDSAEGENAAAADSSSHHP